MRRALILIIAGTVVVAGVAPAEAGEDARGRPPTLAERVDDLQQEIESLTEDIEDLGEPVEEFDLFDQCVYTIGVTQYGSWGSDTGFLFGPGGTGHRPALAMDMRGFGTPQYDFLSFPGEEPPSIECNEDAGEEFIDG
jgi:hypothetical protein